MKIYFILFFIFYFGKMEAQTSINWQKVYGSTNNDEAINIKQYNDGSLLIIAMSEQGISGDKTDVGYGGYDIWLIKTDVSGQNIQWQKVIGGDSLDAVADVILEGDRAYILCSTKSTASGLKTSASRGKSDYWLLSIDQTGNISWQQSYGGSGIDSGAAISLASPTRLVIIGSSTSPISGDKTVQNYTGHTSDIWAIVVNASNGNIIRQKVIGGTDLSPSTGIVKISDNEFVVSTRSYVGSAFDKTDAGFGNNDNWLFTIDTNLNVIADKCFGGTENEDYSEVYKNGQFLYLITISNSNVSGNKTAPQQGTIAIDNQDIWLVKMNLNLDVIWDKTFGGNKNEKFSSLNFIDEKIVLSAYSFSGISGNKTLTNFGALTNPDYWVVALNNDGTIFEQTRYGGAEWDASGGAFLKPNGNLILAGTSYSGISGNKTELHKGNGDIWLLELSTAYLSLTENKSIVSSVFPNPFQKDIQFTFDQNEDYLKVNIFSMDGKLVTEESLPKGTMSHTLQLPPIGNMFLYTVTSSRHSVSGKLVRH